MTAWVRASVLAAGVAGAVVGASPSTAAPPPDFPDLAAYPAVDPAAYQVTGGHPSTSGWAFTTAGGLRCQNSLIPDLGIFCEGLVRDAPSEVMSVNVSLTTPAGFDRREGELETPWSPLLPVGSRFAAGNGVVCAAPDEVTFACWAAKPDSWPADTPDPPDRHYGEHGFLLSPAGHRGY
ncbi:hypothetical protein [Mycolicibacterium gilvum]|uniref:hypothetical protein n=1 Tax=Mycolicibacterium gilvum TaxID=1804 RepID=UPI000C1B22DF